MTSFTRTEIQKAKPWRIIAQKNKGALHISWLPDRISTVSVPWLSFHSSPKTSLSSGGDDGGGSGKEMSIAGPPAAHRGQLRAGSGALPAPLPGCPRSPPRPPGPVALSQTPVQGGQPCRSPARHATVPIPPFLAGSSQQRPGLRVSAAEVVSRASGRQCASGVV